MASLTPLSKGLIGLAVVGAMASAVWHLYLKERMAGASLPPPAAAVSAPPPPDRPAAPTAVATPAPTPVVVPAPVAPPAAAAPGNSLPTAGLSAAENAEAGRKLLAEGDFVRARSHLERAVQDGDAASACLLGEMTLKGQGGIVASTDNAARLFQLAQSRNTICFGAGQ
jgi:hypothetical protein